MLKNYFITAFRNFRRHKLYTFINIAGLALGIAAYILISAYIRFEKSYDRMHRDAENIYRVESRFYKGAQLTDDWATSTNGCVSAMQRHLPEVASYTRINFNNAERVVKYEGIKFREANVCFADSNFFSFFSYPLLSGDANTILKEVNTVAISASAAQKYFGNANPVGKFLDIATQSDHYRCMVSGIFKDIPVNSTLQFNFLISWSSMPTWMKDFWYIHSSYSFVKLKPGVDPAIVETKFPEMAEQYKTSATLKDLRWAIQLAPLQQLHLNPAKLYEPEIKGSVKALHYMDIIALAILLIACVNYINLTTARASERAKEIGVKKVSGASSLQLIIQFLSESFLTSAMALLFALGIVVISTYYLLPLISSDNTYTLLFDRSVYVRVAFVFVISILLTGIYPALVLIRIHPVSMLKGKFSFSTGGKIFRQALVVFQFAASLLLITGTVAVYRQLRYMHEKDTGVQINQTLVVKAPVNTEGYARKVQSFKTVLLDNKQVAKVTLSGSVPGRQVGKSLANKRFGASSSEERTFEMLKVDFDFIKTYQLALCAGRDFDKTRMADSTGLILNESAAKQFGFASPQQAIGEKIWLEVNRGKPNEIIGVVKDYHQQSLQREYTPIILFMDPDYAWIPSDYISVKLGSANMHQAVTSIQQTWNDFFPESSFDFFFLDDFYNRQYLQEKKSGNTFLLFSAIAVIIACMGLAGSTAFAVSRRTKEIGIRKVLGASAGTIVSLLTKDMLKLIVAGCLAAIPIAVLMILQWLQGYAFRVTLTWWQFAIPVVMLLVIAMLCISYITFRAASADPVKSLKTE